ncbi:bestrophin-4-like isoform X2 [Ceratina calcarata]|nr:bestrophin-4-like isoform X2 [Ceratina calcarata]
MHLVALYITGDDEYSRMIRRALMRYLNLSLILVLRSISSAVKKRFPTYEHVVDSGFMTELELDLFLAVPSSEFNTYWIPCTWFINLLKEARKNQRIPDPQGLKLIMEEFSDFRTKCGMLWSYDWISIPLVYTQVVTLATYSFFLVALMARQYIDGKEKQFQLQVDIYIPVFTILQFFFFMGLLKVAEQLINPFGDDDEDFELNWIIDRHTKVSYLGVDTLMNRCPPLVKDIYFDAENLILPYTEAAAAYKKKTYRGSVANMTVPEEKQTMFLPDVMEEDEEEGKPSRHSSTLSLGHGNDSPFCERRQISPRLQSVTTTDRSSPDTVQIRIQETGETEQRPNQLIENMKKFGMHSISRSESGRKQFFAITRSPKVVVQPSSSTSSLSKPTRQFIDTPTVYVGDLNPWKNYNSKGAQPVFEMIDLDSPETEKQFEFQVPSSLDDVTDSPHSDICQSQYLHTSHLTIPETKTKTSVPRSKSPKFLVKKPRPVPKKKKGIQWKAMKDKKILTNDNESVFEMPLSYTRSSPNLKLGESSQKPKEDDSSSNKEE